LNRLTPLLLAAAVGLCAGAADAKTCRNTAGKFVACPTTPAAASTCRDANGKFIKCTAAAGMHTATCKDGSVSQMKQRMGACSGHGGVVSWK